MTKSILDTVARVSLWVVLVLKARCIFPSGFNISPGWLHAELLGCLAMVILYWRVMMLPALQNGSLSSTSRLAAAVVRIRSQITDAAIQWTKTKLFHISAPSTVASVER